MAMPLGMGYTVEGQVTGDERFGGIQLVSLAQAGAPQGVVADGDWSR